MRVAVIFDDVAARPAPTPDERGVLEAVSAVDASLRELGHAPTQVPIGPRPAAWLARLARAAPDAVFNLCEGVGGSSAHEAHVAAALELAGYAVTGASADTLALCRRKDRVNALLRQSGVPVPDWLPVRSRDEAMAWQIFPAMVKPTGEDASVGIDQGSVARDHTELASAVSRGATRGGVLVQRFVAGAELNVGLVGTVALPVAEIDFGALPPDLWPIVSYRAKWEAGSVEDLGTTPRCPAPISQEVAEQAVALAGRAWRCVEGRGYGRVDLRADEQGRLHVLEVNPNPDLAPSAGLARMALAAGWDYTELVQRILREADA